LHTKGSLDVDFHQIVQATPGTPSNPGIVSMEMVRHFYDQVAAEETKKTPLSFDELLVAEDLDEQLEFVTEYATRLLATKEESAPGHLFINGKWLAMSGVSLVSAQMIYCC
jgi:hypothetical protein